MTWLFHFLLQLAWVWQQNSISWEYSTLFPVLKCWWDLWLVFRPRKRTIYFKIKYICCYIVCFSDEFLSVILTKYFWASFWQYSRKVDIPVLVFICFPAPKRVITLKPISRINSRRFPQNWPHQNWICKQFLNVKSVYIYRTKSSQKSNFVFVFWGNKNPSNSTFRV